MSQDTTPRFVLATGHSADAVYARFLPDGKTIVSLGHDRAMILWDASTGEMLRKHQYPGPNFWWNGLSPDGLHAIADASLSGTVIFDTLTGKESRVFDGCVRLAISHDGRLLAYEDAHEIVIEELATGNAVKRLPHNGERGVECMAFSPDGSSLAFSPYSQKDHEPAVIRLYDLASGACQVLSLNPAQFPGDPAKLEYVTFEEMEITLDGFYLAGKSHSDVHVWDLRTGSHLLSVVDGMLLSSLLSPDGCTMLTGHDNGVVSFWNVESRSIVRRVTAVCDWIRVLAFSPSGEHLVTDGYGREIRVWTSGMERCLSTMVGHDYCVNSIAFSPDGRTLFSGNSDGTLRMWNGPSRSLAKTVAVPKGRFVDIALSPAGDTVAGMVRDGDGWDSACVVLWDAHTGARLNGMSAYGSPNALAFLNGGDVLLYQPKENVLAGVHVPTAETWFRKSANRPIAVSPDGRLLATGNACRGECCCSLSTRIEVRSAETGALAHTLCVVSEHFGIDEPVNVMFSPDSKSLAIGHLGFGVSLWDTATGELIGKIGTRGDSVGAIAFSPDGRTLVAGTGYDESVELFSPRTLKRRRRLIEHTNNVNSVAFSPDGKVLATGSSDGTIKLWNPRNGQLLSTLVILPSVEGISQEWLAYTPEGYYTGSENAEEYIRWEVDGTLHPGAQYAERFRHRRLP